MASDLIVEERAFPLQGASSVEVDLDMTSGEVRLAGGASDLAEALFRYSHPQLQPEVEYDVDGDEAELGISQPPARELQNPRVEWDLRLNSEIDVDLAIEVASGNAHLDLSAVCLTGLEVQAGSGQVTAILGGEYADLEELRFAMRSGDLALDLGGRFEELDMLAIETASGTVRLGLTGEYVALDQVDIAATSGIVNLDLRGQWPAGDVDVRVQVTSGNVTIQIPDDAGVSLEARVMSGMVSAGALEAGDGRWTSAGFEQSETKVWLAVEVTTGMVRVA